MFPTLMLINFLLQILTVQCTETFVRICFAHQNMKNPPLKIGHFSKIEKNVITALAAQTVKFLFLNMAYYVPTVNKTGLFRRYIILDKCQLNSIQF